MIQATKHNSYFFLHGSSPLLFLVTLDMFACLIFSAAPKPSIEGQESTDVGRDRKMHVRNGVARLVLLSPLSVCPSPPSHSKPTR